MPPWPAWACGATVSGWFHSWSQRRMSSTSVRWVTSIAAASSRKPGGTGRAEASRTISIPCWFWGISICRNITSAAL